MNFIKNHYEKIILSVVLLGLAVAAAALPLQVTREQTSIDETISRAIHSKAKPFEPVNLTTNQIVLAKLSNPPKIKLSGIHNLFNPVPWKKTPDGQWIKEQTGKEIGPGALQISRIQPLKFEITFKGADKPERPGERVKLHFSVLDERKPHAREEAHFAKVNDRLNIFRVVDARPAEDPKEVDLEVGGQKITLSDSKPSWSQIVGYSADLFYPLGKLTLKDKRAKDAIQLPNDAEHYKIVAIDTNEVVLSADSTKKRTVIALNSRPSTPP